MPSVRFFWFTEKGRNMFRVLVINPGGGSTKVAVCEDADCVLTRFGVLTNDRL